VPPLRGPRRRPAAVRCDRQAETQLPHPAAQLAQRADQTLHRCTVSFSVAAPVGTLAIAPLGPDYTALGVMTGLSAAIFGGLVTSIASKATDLKSGPITATAVLWSAALAQVLSLSGGSVAVERALALTCLWR
jgi:hypothetical protein